MQSFIERKAILYIILNSYRIPISTTRSHSSSHYFYSPLLSSFIIITITDYNPEATPRVEVNKSIILSTRRDRPRIHPPRKFQDPFTPCSIPLFMNETFIHWTIASNFDSIRAARMQLRIGCLTPASCANSSIAIVNRVTCLERSHRIQNSSTIGVAWEQNVELDLWQRYYVVILEKRDCCREELIRIWCIPRKLIFIW